MADLGETFDGSVYMEIGGNYASAPADPIRPALDARAIFANMASRFAGAPASPHAQLLDRRASNTTLGETFNGDDYPATLSAIEELSTYQQWVCWAFVTRPGATKPTKPPMSPHTGRGASHAKSSDWGTYDQARAMAERRKFAGVGFVLTEDDGYTGIDLDKCRDPETGKLDLWAEDIVALGETYWELSPSGTGLRAIVRGKIAKTVKCDTAHVEVYRSLRYLTITGDHIEGTPEDIRPAPTTLEWLMARVEQFAPKEIEPAPGAHLKIVKSDQAIVSSETAHRPHNDAGERAYAKTALDGNSAELASTGAGGRNHALNAKAFRMGRMVARGWIEKSRVEAALTDACRANGYVKDKGIKATRETLASGLRGGMAAPHEDLPDNHDDDAELLAAGTKIAQLLIEKEDGLQQDNGPQPTAADLLDGWSFDGDALPEPPPMLVKKLIPLDGIAFVGGQSGAGKTFIVIDLAVSVASGEHFFEHKVVERVGVAIFAAEGAGTIASRVAVARDHKAHGEILPIAWLGGVPNLADPKEVKAMVNRLRAVDARFRSEHGVRLGMVICDTLAATFDLNDENDNSEAAKAIRVMKVLSDALRVVVVPVHHFGKAATTGLRGASGWRAGCDSVLSVLASRDETTGKCRDRQLVLTKSRVGEEGWRVAFDLSFVELGEDEDGDPFGACFVEPGEAEDSDIVMSRPKPLPRAARAYLDALHIVAGEKGRKVRPFGSEGPEVNAVDRERVRDEFYLAWPADGDDEKARKNAKRKSFKRGEDEAIERHRIGTYEVDGEQLVWLLLEPAP
jgi:hypothetical protein